MIARCPVCRLMFVVEGVSNLALAPVHENHGGRCSGSLQPLDLLPIEKVGPSVVSVEAIASVKDWGEQGSRATDGPLDFLTACSCAPALLAQAGEHLDGCPQRPKNGGRKLHPSTARSKREAFLSRFLRIAVDFTECDLRREGDRAALSGQLRQLARDVEAP